MARLLTLIAACAPGLLLSFWIGQKIHKRLNLVRFRKLVFAVLALSGLALLWGA